MDRRLSGPANPPREETDYVVAREGRKHRGETTYSRESGRSVLSLQLEAALKAIEDVGLRPSDIDGVIPYASGMLDDEMPMALPPE